MVIPGVDEQFLQSGAKHHGMLSWILYYAYVELVLNQTADREFISSVKLPVIYYLTYYGSFFK